MLLKKSRIVTDKELKVDSSENEYDESNED